MYSCSITQMPISLSAPGPQLYSDGSDPFLFTQFSSFVHSNVKTYPPSVPPQYPSPIALRRSDLLGIAGNLGTMVDERALEIHGENDYSCICPLCSWRMFLCAYLFPAFMHSTAVSWVMTSWKLRNIRGKFEMRNPMTMATKIIAILSSALRLFTLEVFWSAKVAAPFLLGERRRP